MPGHRRRAEFAQQLEAGRGGQPGRVVAGAAPLDVAGEALVVLPGQCQRAYPAGPLGADGEHAGGARGEGPLVQVAEPEVGVRVGRGGQHAGGVGAVHHGGHAAFAQFGEQGRAGHQPGGGRGELVEDGDGGAPVHGGKHRLPDGVLVRGVQRQFGDHQLGSGLGGLAGDGLGDRAVAVVGDQDPVAGGEGDAVQGYRGGLGDVGDQGEPVRVGAEVGGDQGPGGGDPGREVGEEAVRVQLVFGPQPLLRPLYGHGHGAERAVVQVRGLRRHAEQPVGGGQRGRGLGGPQVLDHVVLLHGVLPHDVLPHCVLPRCVFCTTWQHGV